MNGTTAAVTPPWYTTTCVPYISIQACPSSDLQAHQVWGGVWLAFDITALVFLVITLLRRCIFVKENFNTIRLTLIKFILSTPLHIVWDTVRTFGGAAGFGFSGCTTAALVGISYIPAVAGVAMIGTTWMVFSKQSLSERPPIVGNLVLYLALAVPFAVSVAISATIGGISEQIHNVSWRWFFCTWTLFLFAFAALSIVNGIRNLRHFQSVDDKFHRSQLIKMTSVIGFLFIGSGFVCALNAIFLDQINNSQWWFVVNNVYRIFFWILLMGGALYAWVATSYRVEVNSSRNTRRSASGKLSTTNRFRTDESFSPSRVTGSLHSKEDAFSDDSAD